MSYAINKNGDGFRAINSKDDLLAGETYSETLPILLPSVGAQWQSYQRSALSALTASDATMMRITEAIALGNTSWEAEDVLLFVRWRKSLRDILSQPQPNPIPSALPPKPSYPEGT